MQRNPLSSVPYRNVGEKRLFGELIFQEQQLSDPICHPMILMSDTLKHKTTHTVTLRTTHTQFLESRSGASRRHTSPRGSCFLGHQWWSKGSCCDPRGSEPSVADVLVSHAAFSWWEFQSRDCSAHLFIHSQGDSEEMKLLPWQGRIETETHPQPGNETELGQLTFLLLLPRWNLGKPSNFLLYTKPNF